MSRGARVVPEKKKNECTGFLLAKKQLEENNIGFDDLYITREGLMKKTEALDWILKFMKDYEKKHGIKR